MEVWYGGPDAGLPWNTPAEQRCAGVPRLANATLDFDFLAMPDDDPMILYVNMHKTSKNAITLVPPSRTRTIAPSFPEMRSWRPERLQSASWCLI